MSRGRASLRGALLLAPAVLAGGCAAPFGMGTSRISPEDGPLDVRIDHVLAQPPLDGVHWGILLVDPATGGVLYERNPDLRFVPASNMKIPVVAGALELLGPDYQYRTGFFADAPAHDGVVEGDLILIGNGDPTLGEPFYASADAALEALADRLRAAGVRRVEGALVIDASAWDSTSVPSAWMTGNLAGRAGATGGAFAVGAGELLIEATGGERAGEPAIVSWRPMGTTGFVENRVTTVGEGGPAELRPSYLPESRRWVLEGTLPPGARQTLVRAQRDPVRQAGQALLRAVEGRGIEVTAGLRVAWDGTDPLVAGCGEGGLAACAALVPLAELPSPPMSEIARAILEPSQNWMTEQVVRSLGGELGERGGWSEGFDVLGRFLVEEVGIDSLAFHLRDGSGLAAYNLLSPRAVVQVLTYATDRPWGPAFRAAMAEPGREGTTLSSRLEGLEDRVFAKTGTISHVNALSGYLVADDGRELVFAILTNGSNLPANDVRAAIDRVVREMARR